MKRVIDDLTKLTADVRDGSYSIDPATNRITPPTTPRAPILIAIAEMADLQGRLDKILADAARVDDELARAINMATGGEPIPDMPHDNRPEIQDALSKPLPEDPQQFNNLWDQLTREEKDWLYHQDPEIGSHPGMPWVDKNYYNQMYLGRLTNDAQAEVDRLRNQHPDWAASGDSLPQSVTGPPLYSQWEAWKRQWDSANHKLNGFRSVQNELHSPDGVPRYLTVLDDEGLAAVSIGNPDTATRNATFVPGTGQDLPRMQYSTEDAEAMFQAALRADPNLRPEDLSVTTWMGYDPPMDLIEAGDSDYAVNGGDELAGFQEGMRASHEGPQSINTVIGHSYGSTLVGAAASGGNELDVNNVIAVGSPGMLVDNTGQLDLDDGANVYVTRARYDPINLATGFTLGPSPTADAFGAIQFEADDGPTSGPPIFRLPSIDAHSSYWDQGNRALLNMGAVIAGLPPPYLSPPGA